MRRLLALLVIPLLFVALPARAQQASGTPEVTLRLLHQTRWNDPDHTLVKVEVRAANHSDQTLRDLSIFLGVNTATGSRTEYEQSLTQPTGYPIIGNTIVEPGALVPGARVTYKLTQDVTTLANNGGSGIYPMTVELRSHNVPVATLRSPVIFLAKNPPLTPLDLSWSFLLSAPITYGPDGFRSTWLQRAVSPRQPLRDELDALLAMVSSRKPAAFDVAIAPQLVDQLATMSRGYTLQAGGSTQHIAKGTGGAAEAARALFDLRSIVAARPAEVSALPFSSPSVPALIAAGLDRDLPEQLSRGRDNISEVLGHDPSSAIMHPPGSRLDQASLFALQQNGIRLLLVDSNAVHQPQQERGFAKPAVVALPSGSTTPLEAIVPDGGVQALMDGDLPQEDPHLAVQVILGELAQIWLERPSVSRGIALTLSERSNLPGSFFDPFIRSVAAAPFLRSRKATRFARAHPPLPQDGATLKPAATGPEFSASYLQALQDARQSIGTYTSILAQSDPTTTSELDRLILLAESGQYLTNDRGGLAFLGSVTDRLSRQFQSVTLDTSSVVTLTSRSGTIPIPIHNETGHTVKVRVNLEAGGRLAVDGNARLVTVPPDGVTLPFRVQAQTTGRFPVQIQVLTPDGQTELGPPAHLIIRSTAYNRVALVLTIGAALVLLGLWGRRFMPWTKR
jgi:uncharacterized protein DUF6049